MVQSPGRVSTPVNSSDLCAGLGLYKLGSDTRALQQL